MKKVTMIIGDGISPEISQATMDVIKATGAEIYFDIKHAGLGVYEKTGFLLEKGLYDSVEENRVVLKGPITTPIGEGFRSINVELRKKYDLYSNIRPIKTLGDFTGYKDIDIVIFRENTEDLYAGIEEKISDDEMHSIKVVTRKGSMRIAEAAFRYAVENNRRKVTVVTKANIMKLTDGLFLDVAREVSLRYPQIEFEDKLVDNMAMQLVMKPNIYDVILTGNLYGDILSDLCAGLVGGLGLASSANIGDDFAMFEAVHGTVPRLTGRDVANPTALILSGAMMLDYLNMKGEAAKIRSSVEKLLSDKRTCTRDLGGNLRTTEFTKLMVESVHKF